MHTTQLYCASHVTHWNVSYLVIGTYIIIYTVLCRKYSSILFIEKNAYSYQINLHVPH